MTTKLLIPLAVALTFFGCGADDGDGITHEQAPDGGNTGASGASDAGPEGGGGAGAAGPTRRRPPYVGVWGIWGAESLNASDKPWLKGTMVTRTWEHLEPANDEFDFGTLDDGLNLAVNNGYQYLMIKIYTGPAAPPWIYEPESAGGGGVPPVTTEPPGYYGQPYPYYLDPRFKTLFKRMIDRVAEHIESYPSALREKIIAIQCPIGRSGDSSGYFGEPTDPTYAITEDQWVEYSKEMFGYYYDAYKNTDPPIVPLFHATNFELHTWLKDNTPHHWRKNARGGHFYQQHNVYEGHGEEYRQDTLEYQADGWALMARDEMDKTPYPHGVWTEAPEWSMYWTGLHALYFGIDFWNIESLRDMDGPEFVPAYEFFTKHAGNHDPAESEGAWIALRDGLDADDVDRFPESSYGELIPWWSQTQENSAQRYINIANAFSAFGAAQDPDFVPAFYGGSYTFPHLNDVGWDIVHGNFQMYMTQHDPLGTSQGYWRVGPKSQPYGRFARGFNASKGMNAMYFDLDEAFTSGSAPHACKVRVVYYDQGTGSWALRYDAIDDPERVAMTVTKTNSGTWKEAIADISDGNFANRCPHNTDFMLTNEDAEDDIFHMIELTRELPE